MKNNCITFSKLHSIGIKSSSTYKVTSPNSSFVTTSACSYCKIEEIQFSVSKQEGKKLFLKKKNQEDVEQSWDSHIT